ncbi:hypothetical protein LJC31_04800 [Synergistaceae bacterium OttesenSCG-928-I11]|nr:hypothetical protein [Synergistaceae bacterium OttesenSCG-928-I11]
MKMGARIAFVFLTILFAIACPMGAGASTLEEIVEESLYNTLREEGIGDLIAGRISARYVFMGSVMINKVQFDDGEALFSQAQLTGQALGTALATAYLQYGEKALQETASVMMLSVRAGVAPEVAAATLAVLAQNGYAFDASTEIMHEASEIVRALKPNDGGSAICAEISDMIHEQVSVGKLRSEMSSLAEREKNRQRRLIAMREAEKRKKDNQGGEGERSASASKGDKNGGASSSGNDSGANDNSDGASAAGAGRGDSSASGSESAGNDSASGTSGSNDSASDAGASGSSSASSEGSSAGADNAGTDNSGSSSANDSNTSESGKNDQSLQ